MEVDEGERRAKITAVSRMETDLMKMRMIRIGEIRETINKETE